MKALAGTAAATVGGGGGLAGASTAAGGGGGGQGGPTAGGGGGAIAGYQLSPVEAFRAVVLIEEALRQLVFVSKLVPSSNSNQNKNKLDELAISKGDEIVKMIKEQSLLEEK